MDDAVDDHGSGSGMQSLGFARKRRRLTAQGHRLGRALGNLNQLACQGHALLHLGTLHHHVLTGSAHTALHRGIVHLDALTSGEQVVGGLNLVKGAGRSCPQQVVAQEELHAVGGSLQVAQGTFTLKIAILSYLMGRCFGGSLMISGSGLRLGHECAAAEQGKGKGQGGKARLKQGRLPLAGLIVGDRSKGKPQTHQRQGKRCCDELKSLIDHLSRFLSC